MVERDKRKFTVMIQTRFEQRTVDDMDRIIKRDTYDDRSQFIRLAVNKFLKEEKDP